MTSFLPRGDRCTGCGLPAAHCLCDAMPTLACRTRLVVVRHAAERKKASNTGALTAKILGGTCLDHGAPGVRVDLTGTLGPNPRVLLPHGSERLDAPPSTLVVLDGTWQQVRGMRARIPPLSTTPLWSLPAGPQRLRMREHHLVEGRSTMEAVADALDLLGEVDAARELHVIYAELTRRWRMLRQV